MARDRPGTPRGQRTRRGAPLHQPQPDELRRGHGLLSARFMHDEVQSQDKRGGILTARIRGTASPAARIYRAWRRGGDRRPRQGARGYHGHEAFHLPALRRSPWRAYRPDADEGVPHEPRRQREDQGHSPRQRSRHEPGLRSRLRTRDSGREVRRQRPRGRGVPETSARRRHRRNNDDEPQHARTLRARHNEDRGARARLRRPALLRRSQHEPPARRRQARRHGLRHNASQPAQDLLDPSRRRRPRKRPRRSLRETRPAAGQAQGEWVPRQLRRDAQGLCLYPDARQAEHPSRRQALHAQRQLCQGVAQGLLRASHKFRMQARVCLRRPEGA